MSCCTQEQPITFLGLSHLAMQDTKLVDLVTLSGFQRKNFIPLTTSSPERPSKVLSQCKTWDKVNFDCPRVCGGRGEGSSHFQA